MTMSRGWIAVGDDGMCGSNEDGQIEQPCGSAHVLL
jgi:hypothetical protein